MLLFVHTTGLYVTNITNILQITTSLTLSCCQLCPSPGQHYLCWVTATITSRISPTLQSATSSSPSCTRRWRSTRCTTPSPCTKLVFILRPPRPPSCSTTPAVTTRYSTHKYTHTHYGVQTCGVKTFYLQNANFSAAPLRLTAYFMGKWKCLGPGVPSLLENCNLRTNPPYLHWNFFTLFPPSVTHFPSLGALFPQKCSNKYIWAINAQQMK